MPLFDARDILSYPGGDNSSDTVLGGVHFNLTTLDFWNYTLYSNGTLSNGTWCLLTFEPYTPALVLPNGTFVNVTWCWYPVYPIGTRAGTGLGFAVLFGLGLVLTLIALGKHGKLYLPAETRFRPIGRRWQWYWAIFVCAAALISLLTNIDVDRYYLPELPIVLNTFFWFLMQQGAIATVWEAVRHWGSWMERQFIDPNPFALRLDDRRAQVEFWLPLFFYFWLWMNFFLIVPRNWERIEFQRYPQQTLTEAIPTATDGRFKAAAFCLFICWLTTVFSLRHSIKHYCERNRGLFNRAIGLVRFTPLRFVLMIPIALVIPFYQALVAWEFAWSPLNIHGNNAAIYGGGYAPALLIVLINAIFGFINPNEDRELLRQRRVRDDQIDREIGIVKKPAWWRRVKGENIPGESMRDRIARNVRELGGGKPTARNLGTTIPTTRMVDIEAPESPGEEVEMGPLSSIQRSVSQRQAGSGVPAEFIPEVAPGDFGAARAVVDKYAGKSDRRRQERTAAIAAGLLFPAEGSSVPAINDPQRRAELMQDGPPPPPYPDSQRGRQNDARPGTMDRSHSSATTNSITAPPQQIRSMLDV
ncbi:hypothetical protein QBC46DRAFT_461730 [Diplogelasinospora grovesii]|uniref:Uncharacterized protein n=1 Tax=Diplogelasinospora grovesii TaxID=303347 RepID=A0AAN6N0D9_9PEZI|nr:hypothetical protein QBC46DRAFT_461730 [Diplogelasinospora grovesii]